jgi:hypothetical protein
MLRFAIRRGGSLSERGATRYRRFCGLLSELCNEITEEINDLQKAAERNAACAAFAVEALENGDEEGKLPSSLNHLTASLVKNSNRIVVLHHQRAILSQVEHTVIQFAAGAFLPTCDIEDRVREGDAGT